MLILRLTLYRQFRYEPSNVKHNGYTRMQLLVEACPHQGLIYSTVSDCLLTRTANRIWPRLSYPKGDESP